MIRSLPPTANHWRLINESHGQNMGIHDLHEASQALDLS